MNASQKKSYGPGNSVFDAHSKFIYESLALGVPVSTINAALRLPPHNCPPRKYQSLWKWISKRAKGYRPSRKYADLGAKMAQPAPPPPPLVKPRVNPNAKYEARNSKQAKKLSYSADITTR